MLQTEGEDAKELEAVSVHFGNPREAHRTATKDPRWTFNKVYFERGQRTCVLRYILYACSQHTTTPHAPDNQIQGQFRH